MLCGSPYRPCLALSLLGLTSVVKKCGQSSEELKMVFVNAVGFKYLLETFKQFCGKHYLIKFKIQVRLAVQKLIQSNKKDNI